MLILAPLDSGTNSGTLLAPHSKENSKDEIDPMSSNNTIDDLEPTLPKIED